MSAPVTEGASAWVRTLGVYRTPSAWRGAYELATTIVPFCVGWLLMLWASSHGQLWLYLLLLLPTAGLMVRLFLIQHDCGHRAFFPGQRANDWMGRSLGVLTLTPYDHWRRCHAIHHATHGNLDRRGVGDVDTLTVAEYLARSRWARLRYRAYRHPLVMFGIGPAFVFLLTNRFPGGFLHGGWRPWASTMGTNVAIVAAGALTMWAFGATALLRVHVPILMIAGSVGIWLFYVQHQFERTRW
ncbi:MAG TPA: fatty acid desaturase, partial [Dokdonella sp.]